MLSVDRWLPVSRGVFALALAVLLWSAYDGARRVLPQWQVVPSRHAPLDDASAGNKPAHAEYDIARLIDAHLFGTVRKEPEQEAAPETRLRIGLLGLVASPDQRLARALIRVNGAGVKPYAIGQTIDGTDAKVHRVGRTRVLLKRGAALESLRLERAEIEGLSRHPADGS